jgi:hypothetical protein
MPDVTHRCLPSNPITPNPNHPSQAPSRTPPAKWRPLPSRHLNQRFTSLKRRQHPQTPSQTTPAIPLARIRQPHPITPRPAPTPPFGARHPIPRHSPPPKKKRYQIITCKMPLSSGRSSTRTFPRISVGKSGSIFAYCSSDSQNKFRLIFPSRIGSSESSDIENINNFIRF